MSGESYPRRGPPQSPSSRLTPDDDDLLISGLAQNSTLREPAYLRTIVEERQETREEPREDPATPGELADPPREIPFPDIGDGDQLQLVGRPFSPDILEIEQNADNPTYDVNDAIERAGWGWYHTKVLFVMGFMSFADAAEIWLATVIIKDLKCEWDLSSFQKSMIPAVVYIFYAFGSMTSGYFSDKFGRYWVLLINSYALIFSGVLSAFATNYYFFIICRSLTGFCIGGNYACSIVYAQEVMPAKYRSWNMLFLEIYWTLGSLYECFIALFVMQLDNGWRYQVLLTALPIVAMLIAMHFMDESPRYLVINNRKEEAQKVLEKMCKDNQVEVIKGDLYAKEVRSGEFWDVWAKPNTCESLTITIHFVCNMFLVFGISMLIPDAMSYNYCGLDMWFDTTYVNDEGCTVYTRAEYVFMMITAIIFIPGMILATWLADFIGRRMTFVVSIFGGAIFSVLLILCINSYLTYITLLGAAFFYAAYNQVLWVYTPEFYATYMRGTACGIQNGIGKFGAAAGTFLTTYLDEFDVTYSVYCFIGVQLIACATVLFMKRETLGQNLQDTRSNENTPIKEEAYGTE
eukprot:sb/3463397/